MLRAIQSGGLFRSGDHVLVATSGGPDSTALLLALDALRDELEISLTAASLDHELRPGPEREADAAFVRRVCADLDIPRITASRDIPTLAARLGQGVEAAARRARYAWLALVARQVGARVVTTGHTQDDVAETVLLRLITGTGLDGLRSIRPQSAWPIDLEEMTKLEPELAGEINHPPATHGDQDPWPPRLVRPMLGIARSDVLDYLALQRVTARGDPTNEDPAFLRNRVRHELLPLLETMNPAVRVALARLARSAAEELELIDALALEAWTRTTLDDALNADGVGTAGVPPHLRSTAPDAARIELDREAFRTLAPALQRRVLRRAARELGGDTRAWGWDRLEEARAWALGGHAGGLMTLPGGIWLLVERRKLLLTRGERPARMESLAST